MSYCGLYREGKEKVKTWISLFPKNSRYFNNDNENLTFPYQLNYSGKRRLLAKEGAMSRGTVTIPRWLPFLVGLIVFIATLWLWRALSANEERQIERMISSEMGNVRNAITARLQSHILALVRMARRWEDRGQPSEQEWEAEAELTTSHFADYQAIVWIDPWFFIRWTTPLANQGVEQELNLAFAERRRAAIDAVRNRREVTMTHAVEIQPDTLGFFIYVPIFREDQFNGIIAGVVGFRELFDSSLHNVLTPGYGLAIFDGQDELHRYSHLNQPEAPPQLHEAALSLYGMTWRLQVWPEAAVLKGARSLLPEMALCVGMLLATLLTITGALARTAQLRAKAEEDVNQELQREVAERTRAEEAIRTLNEELEQRVLERTAQLAEANRELQGEISERQRMERQRQEFLTMLTHDIRNPLSVVLGYIDLLQEELNTRRNEDISKEILPRLRSNTLTVFSLVDNYLDVSCLEDRPFHLTKEAVDLNLLLSRVGQHYEIEARRRHIMLSFSLQPETPPVQGNLVALERVMSNLIHNALKFTPEHGCITISSSRTAHDVIASISDTGPGIAQEDIPILFEKYRRIEHAETHEGNGLGLFIVKALVEAHGGRVEVQSTIHQGACFSVILPLAQVERTQELS
jgi:signal transduction histidine kinase